MGAAPGPDYQLTKAEDVQPHDITHGFSSGLYAIDGGRMDGYNIIGSGQDKSGYAYFDRSGIPNYWKYADRFVLADHFFTSMYGPTFPEHLYTVAAQSYGIVDNKSTVDHPGSYCDDPTEYAPRFPLEKLSEPTWPRSPKLENHITQKIPDQLYKISQYWVQARTCVPIKSLPDELQAAGVYWKYYALKDHWMNGLQAIRHDRFTPAIWSKVQDPSNFIDDVKVGAPPCGVLADPARALQRASRRLRPQQFELLSDLRLRGRELDRESDQHGHAESLLAVHGDRRGVG